MIGVLVFGRVMARNEGHRSLPGSKSFESHESALAYGFIAVPLAAVSALSPARQWVPPAQPLNINVNAEGDSKLMLTDFTGAAIEPKK